jgi:hypothetical protein
MIAYVSVMFLSDWRYFVRLLALQEKEKLDYSMTFDVFEIARVA